LKIENPKKKSKKGFDYSSEKIYFLTSNSARVLFCRRNTLV